MSIYEEMGFTPATERASEAALYSLARTFSLINRRFHRFYAEHALTPAKVNVLMLVKHAGGSHGIPQREIADRLIITGADVTGLIDRLERDGLLARHAGRDRRVKLVKITAKGLALLERIWPAHLAATDRVMQALSPREQRSLIELLSRLRAGLRGPAAGNGEPR